MMNMHFVSFSVPVVLFDPTQVIDAHASFCKWWLSFWIPPKHEVIDWPKTLTQLPARPDIAPEDLPEDVLRFAEA